MEETNDSDIYADLPKFSYFDGLDKLQATNKSLNQEIIQLNETLIKITKEKDEYQTKCATLTNNISSLLKTAQAEIQRKDKLIRELRDQIANSKTQSQWRKRRFHEEEAYHAKRINSSKDFIAEKPRRVGDTKLNRSLDKISKENKNIVSENNDLSMCNNNNVRNAVIPDPKHNGTNSSSRRNGEIYTASNIKALLPRGACKTLYSQRMFKKMHGLPVTNKSQEVVQIESGNNQIVTDGENISGNDTINAGNTKLIENNANKQPKDLDKRSPISSSNAEIADASSTPSLTNASNTINNCLESANKSLGDISMLGTENDVKEHDDGRKSLEPAPNITDLQSTPFLKNNAKIIALDQKSKSLKALPLLELPSMENNLINKKEMNDLEIGNRTCENELFFRKEQSNQQTSQTKSQNLEESTKPTVNDIKSDTPKFLRPLSSTVIKKPLKKIILPVSNCWNGLVKTVDNVKEKKESEQIRNAETVPATSSSVTNSFNENKHIDQDKLNSSKTRPNNVLEDLFGSPLKWAENSNETTPLLELNSPTVYEDSCSAHIENAKFNLASIKPAEQKPDPIITNHSPERNALNYKTVIQNRNQNEQLSAEKGITSVSTNKAVRPFEEVGSNKQRVKSIFSPLKTDSCKSSASVLNKNTGSSVDSTLNFLFKSKYEDSVLGQFDDTTQFVSALTKVESKISPLNTPVKSLSKPVTGIKTLSSNMGHKSFSQVYQKLEGNQITSTLSSISNQKNFNDKPVNILYPRKTPRIITYNKSTEEKSTTKQSSVVNDTPTKSNRFAINDAFISQQEEKVKRICKNNFNDPIAITICAKNKVKGKDFSTHHSPQGKGSQTYSPKKSKLSPSCLKKNRGTLPGDLTNQKKLSNGLNVVGLPKNGNKKPLQSQFSNENSPYVLIEKNSEKIAVEFPVNRNESVQETDQKGISGLHNINNTIDNCIEKINKKENFNDFTTHSVPDRRKSNDSLENADKPDNNVEELHPNKSCTPSTNTYLRKKYIENTTGVSSENKKMIVTKENAIRSDTSKESVNPPTEDPAHNETIVTHSLNIKRHCDRIRVQNFKPSSHLRKSNKHSLQYKNQECVRGVKNIPASIHEVSCTVNVFKDTDTSNYNENTPEKWKSNDDKAESRVLSGIINQDLQRCCTSLKDLKKSPNIIIRSSKKPAFVSTTLSDDDFASNTVIKSPDIDCRNHNKVSEVKEWILKPITFDSDHRSYKKIRETDNQKEVPRTVKHHSNNKTTVSCNIGSNDITNKSNKFAVPVRNSCNSVSSPNKKVILARRPLNFGVKVTLD